jgi:hypothetical protein
MGGRLGDGHVKNARRAYRKYKGYGNDSRQTGPLPSRYLHNDPDDRFAFSLIMRTRRPSRRTVSALGEGRRALVFRPFRHSVRCCHAHTESEVRSRLPPNYEHNTLRPDEAAVTFCGPESGHRKSLF